jgi:hypothetical protein
VMAHNNDVSVSYEYHTTISKGQLFPTLQSVTF